MVNLELSFGIVAILITIYILSSLRVSLDRIPFLSSYLRPETRPGKAELVQETETAVASVEKETSFSSNWWTEEKIYQLERRAIFSKTWHYAAPLSAFKKPGDYLTLVICGLSIFLILGKDRRVRAFHNVCRHRAYEVTRKECGSSTVLGCRYHGWSYDTLGRLIKAPEFDNVKGFEKEKNALWGVKVRVQRDAVVFVNLDAGDLPETTEMENLERGTKSWTLAGSKMVDQWKIEGNFNWKLAVNAFDGGDISTSNDGESGYDPFAMFFTKRKPRIVHAWPLTTLHYEPSRGDWFCVKLIPESTTKTTISCEYHSKRAGSKSELYKPIVGALKGKISTKIQELEAIQTKLLIDSIALTTAQHQHQENLHLHLKSHLKLERLEGREVHPASRQQTLSAAGQQDDDLCRQLEKDSIAMIATVEIGTDGRPARDALDW